MSSFYFSIVQELFNKYGYDISITVDFILAFTKCLHIIFRKNYTLLIACLLNLQ